MIEHAREHRRSALADRARLRLCRRRRAVAVLGSRRRALRPASSRAARRVSASRMRPPRSRSSVSCRIGLHVGAGAIRAGLCAVSLAGSIPGACRGGPRSFSTSRTIRTPREFSRPRSGTMGYFPETIAVFGMLADKDDRRRDCRGQKRVSTAGSWRRSRVRAAPRADALRGELTARRRSRRPRSARSTASKRRSLRRAMKRAKLIELSFSDRS